MDWRDEAAGELPRPSPREPRSLRQDLLDEVQDHLLLAAEAERAADEDASDDEIRKSVIERFGNPAAVVRRLWWDAMKEAVMRDRIIAGAAVVTAVAFVLFVVGVWMQMSNRQDALLTAIQELKQGEARPEYETTLVVHRGALDGPPAEGIEVRVSHKPPEGDTISVSNATSADGSVTFKFQNEGNYDLTLFDPVSSMTLKKQLTIFAGHGEGEQHIAAPDVGSAELRLQSPLPPEISDDEALLLVELGCDASVGDEEGEPTTWEFRDTVVVGRQGVSDNVSGRRFPLVRPRLPTSPVGYFMELPAPRDASLKTPNLTLSVLAVRPAVADNQNEAQQGTHFMPSPRQPDPRQRLDYTLEGCTITPGENEQLLPLPAITLEAMLDTVRYMRMANLVDDKETEWPALVRDLCEGLPTRTSILQTSRLLTGEGDNGQKVFVQVADEDPVPASEQVQETLLASGSKYGVLLTLGERFDAAYPDSEMRCLVTGLQDVYMKDGGRPAEVYLIGREDSTLESEFTVFDPHQFNWGLLSVTLPQELRVVEAGTQFLIPTQQSNRWRAPLLAEFEEPDLTLAKEAMALCPEGE